MRRLLVFLAAFATATPALATVDPAITRAIEKVKPSDYPSAKSLWVLDDQSVVYQLDGAFTNTVHTAQLVLTLPGRAEVVSKSLYYAKDAEKMEVLSAQVVKKDGTVVPVGKDEIQDVEQSGEANIYDPNGRAVRITFPNVGVGDVVDLTYRLTRRTPTRVGFFNDVFAFQSVEPIAEARYSVDGPASMPLTSAIYHRDRTSKIVARHARVGSRIHYSWSVRNAPQLVPERSMNTTTELPMLVVSTDPSWQDFSKWWAKLTDPLIHATPEIKAEVAQLTKNATTRREKIKALYDFVAQDIRYRGLGVGPRTGYTPRKADETFRSRWGVCRDVSILLTTMLRQAGLQAYPVLTNFGDPVLPKIAYDGFNHAIVAMPKPGGGWTYLDPTAKNDRALLPGVEAEQNTLVATLKGEPLTKIPALPPSANLGHAIATTTIAPDGSMTSEVKLETKGTFDLIFRSMAAERSKVQLRHLAERIFHASLPRAELKSFRISNPLDLSTPMEIDLTLKVPDAAPKTGKYRLARTLVTSGSLGLVESLLPRIFGALPQREYGVDAQMTFEYDEDETITLPGGTQVLALPNVAQATSKVTRVIAKCVERDATTVACHRSFRLESRFINPTQYSALRDSFVALGRVARQPIILAAEAK